MKEQYMDIPVNIRQRLDDVNGDEYCGFYVTEVTFKCDVTLETKLWDLARNIQSQLKTIIGQDQHLLFAKVKFIFSKKATNFETISHLIWFYYVNVKSSGRLFQVFCGLFIMFEF